MFSSTKQPSLSLFIKQFKFYFEIFEPSHHALLTKFRDQISIFASAERPSPGRQMPERSDLSERRSDQSGPNFEPRKFFGILRHGTRSQPGSACWRPPSSRFDPSASNFRKAKAQTDAS